MGRAKPIPSDPAPQLHPSSRPCLVVPADSTNTLHARRRWRVLNAEESFDASDHAADWSGDNGTDRACNAIAFSRAIFEAAGKPPFSLSRDRCRQGCNDHTCVQYRRFHDIIPRSLFRQRQTPANVGVSVTLAWRREDKRLSESATFTLAARAANSSQRECDDSAVGTTILWMRALQGDYLLTLT
jgi:hypothetical protein